MITVAIVDDDREVLMLLEKILQDEPDLSHVGSVASGAAGLRLIKELRPDVVLMDIRMRDINGIECVRQLKPVCKKTEFVMCTVYDEDQMVYDALRAGASSYLMKDNDAAFIADTIREVADGKSPMSSDIARKLVRQMQQVPAKQKFGITAKEALVLEQLSFGRTYQEIADQLHIGVKTLKSYIYSIYTKLQVNNKVEAINKYYNKPYGR
ncbi:response regulator transcription factor [Niabella drilacis]|uniref:Two component transcriptional regulator, LuxR family n=1 Tax=Niabella drilacis (strain DSM 25811 / CCM 8410 / CCUG 62505 / LMG 26954 / E90) TaxID=1285928 RepID=A0A1G7C7L7_NIADE|nr:response regulator transcription factor [Niabella drilacis]SDE35309.1 two component transcriptional regulator, LuxR family [Niabella drilacis]